MTRIKTRKEGPRITLIFADFYLFLFVFCLLFFWACLLFVICNLPFGYGVVSPGLGFQKLLISDIIKHC